MISGSSVSQIRGRQMGQSIKVDVEAIRKASEALTAAEMASLTVLLTLASKRHVELPELLEAIHALIP